MIYRGRNQAEERLSHPVGLPLLKLVAALSLLLPLAIFLVTASISYEAHFKNSREHLESQADLALQHARRIFAIFDLAASQTEEAIIEYDEAGIAAHDAEISAKLGRLSSALPEIEDIWVVDARGRPLVTSGITPAPRNVDFSKEDFFLAQREPGRGTFVSARVAGFFQPGMFFKVSYRRHLPDNGFRGAIVLTGDPRSFEPFYAKMLGEGVSVMSLVRADGGVLARVPMVDIPLQLKLNSEFSRAREINSDRGSYTDVSPIDGVERILVFRSLSPLPVYVLAGLDVAQIRRQWRQAMLRYLYFGLPATLALFVISLAAVRQARRQDDIFAELQREVHRRAFAEEALRQANKMEAIGRLTGGVAHDFNNLLQVMLGRLARIHKAGEQRQPPALRDIDAMQFAIDRAANLTHRLLAFSRQQPLRMDVVDANRLVADMAELVRQTAGNEIVVETIYASDLWPILVDANQLENAILNLTSNARDAMGEGGRITIRTNNIVADEALLSGHPDIAPGQYVCISVSDTGQGIPAEMLEKIFEPFFTTKPVGQGTGLGLSMVYGFIRQSGGYVTISSEIGKGTSVELFLPRAVGEAQDAAVLPRAPTAEVAGSGVVLVVEDEVEVRRLIVDTLRDAGYTVLAAPTARDGLRLLADNSAVQLLLSDVGLPDGMNGHQFATAARERVPGLKVILVSGYARHALVGGADAEHDLLTKPFSRAALIRKIREALAPRDVAS